MKKIMVTLVSVAFALLPFNPASAYSHANRYGGSTSHSEGSTSHTSDAGTSTSHTAGEGSSHTNEYGGSTSHSEYGGTSHTNTYGGTTSGEAGYGATHTDTYGATRLPSTRTGLCVPSANDRGLLRSRMLQLQQWLDGGSGRRGRGGWRYGGRSGSFLPERSRLPERLCARLQRRRIQHQHCQRQCSSGKCECRSRQRQCCGCQCERCHCERRVHDGLSPRGLACWLYSTQRFRWRSLLLVWKHVVQSSVWCEWRALYGGARSIAIRVLTASERLQWSRREHYHAQSTPDIGRIQNWSMSPITISVIVFACVFGGGLLGTLIHSRLPNKHLDSDSKEAVRLGMALVGTTLALVLGLLIASEQGLLRYAELGSGAARRGCRVAGSRPVPIRTRNERNT